MRGDSRIEGADDHAGLDHGGEIGGVDFKDLVHLLERKHDPLFQRHSAAAEVRARTTGINGDLVGAGKIDQFLHHGAVGGQHYHIRHLAGHIRGGIVTVRHPVHLAGQHVFFPCQ